MSGAARCLKCWGELDSPDYRLWNYCPWCGEPFEEEEEE